MTLSLHMYKLFIYDPSTSFLISWGQRKKEILIMSRCITFFFLFFFVFGRILTKKNYYKFYLFILLRVQLLISNHLRIRI